VLKLNCDSTEEQERVLGFVLVLATNGGAGVLAEIVQDLSVDNTILVEVGDLGTA